MEKRLILFLILSMGLMTGYLALYHYLTAPIPAHYLWVMVQDSPAPARADIYFEETPAPGDGEYLDPIAATGKAWIRTVDAPQPQALELAEVKRDEHRWLSAETPQPAPRSVDCYAKFGVYRYGRTDVLLHCYARHLDVSDHDDLHELARAEQLALDIVPHEVDGQIELTVLWQGKPAPGRTIDVHGPGGMRVNPTTDGQGKAAFKIDAAGRYTLRTNVEVPSDGVENGQQYESIRHHATMTLRLGANEGKETDLAAGKGRQPPVERLEPVEPDSQLVERPEVKPQAPESYITVGAYNGASQFPFQVTFSTRGAGITRLELTERDSRGRLRYLELETKGAYLGVTALRADPGGGHLVQAVGPGTPAAEAGLKVGDVIVTANGQPLETASDLRRALQQAKPGDQWDLEVRRAGKTMSLLIKLSRPPLQLIRPEQLANGMLAGAPPSFTLDLLPGDDLPLHLDQVIWEVSRLPKREGVEFHYAVDQASGSLDIYKRFWITPAGEGAEAGDSDGSQLEHHLHYEVELKNTGAKPFNTTCQFNGANGLTTEGWWYQYKIHPRMFHRAGARDIICGLDTQGQLMRGAPDIYSQAQEELEEMDDPPPAPVYTAVDPFFVEDEPAEKRRVRYIGVDTQYFTVALLPHDFDQGGLISMGRAEPLMVGSPDDLEKSYIETTNTSFRLVTEPLVIEPQESKVHSYKIFAGPKRPEVLASYDLEPAIEYGWFPWVAKPLGGILHLLYAVVRNYGLAIILLTVLVRGAMFPLGRKAAQNAQMMQQLAPEIQKIKEKYKGDLQKQGEAQKELYKKYNFNPLSGCLPMLIQLPIFLGLYRCLSVDIELRQAPLIPGIDWCSNLAGPDQLAHWEGVMFFSSKAGFLGPYFNILPIATIGLFLLQQKMFTPPAMDEQQQMQQKIMTFMMLFIGIMFFKVPSGLCIYFIASSLWGIGERKLLPKPEPPKGGFGGSGGSGKGPKGPPPKKPEPSKATIVARERARQRAQVKPLTPADDTMQVDDTIAAVASPPSGALRAVVRISGPRTSDVLAHCFVGDDPRWAAARRPARWTGQLDCGPPLGQLPVSLLYLPGNRSYTRQVSAEIHLPGSPPLADAVLQLVCRHGARLAAPGEFTLRAFLAGRIDLTQAEAVLGVIDARSRQELDVALRQLAGGLAQPLGRLRSRLLIALSHLEAGLDFVEEDIEFISQHQLQTTIEDIRRGVERLQRQMDHRGQADETPRAVLYGLPNSGKSSLFNRLCRENRAIVAPTSGTTRDYLAARVELSQLPCELIDTAGRVERPLAEADQDAQGAAEQQCQTAHLRLLCLDASRQRDSWELEQLATDDDARLIVWTKCDLAPDAPRQPDGLRTSARTGLGCPQLRAAIAHRLQSALGVGPEVIAGTALRSAVSVERAAEALKRAAELTAQGHGQELVAAELRWALNELAHVAGAVDADDVLDQIFSRFCIGK